MKIKLSAIIFIICSFLISCAKEDVKKQESAPVATFSINEDVLNVKLDSTVSFRAKVESSSEYTCAWYVGDEKISGIENVSYVFRQKGEFIVRFIAENSLGKVEKEYRVNVTGRLLVVDFSLQPLSPVTLDMGDNLHIEANVVSGDKDTKHEWKLNGKVVSTNTVFDYRFTDFGDYVLEYKGVNGDEEEASGTWNVKVKDLPLNIAFSLDDTDVEVVKGKSLSINADVKSGSTGLVQEWYVNDSPVSKSASFSYTFNTLGSFTVRYSARNEAGESLSKTWNVSVVQPQIQSLVFDNFETGQKGTSSYYIGNVVGTNILSVVPNPYKTSTNGSDYVLLDEGSKMTYASSSYFKFKISTYPDGRALNADVRAQYSKLRVKVYLGDSGFTPLLQEDAKSTKSTPCEINGVAFDTANPSMATWNEAIKTNDWNVFVYDLTGPKYSVEVNNFAQTEQLQFRVSVNFTNQSQMPRDVYFDDFEFIK